MLSESPLEPHISVVVPTRHRDDLLALCLERLAPGAQTLPSDQYEVIVTDDGQQSTAEKLLLDRFAWAKWVKGPVKGPAANRNNGASHARGKWVAFTDDDCLPSAEWLHSFYQASVKGGTVFEGKTICSEGLTSPLQHAPLNDSGGALWSCNMMVRRDYFDRLQGFDEKFLWPHLEDVDFRERVYGVGDTIEFVPDALIDHPPRPAHFGAKAVAMHEAEFLFYYKTGHRQPYFVHHLRRMVSSRIDLLRRYPLSPTSIRVLGYLLPELLYVARHGNQWQRKYRELYRDTTVSYARDMPSRLYHMQW